MTQMSISPDDWGSAGSSLGKAEVLVFRELRYTGRSRSHQSCWAISWGFRWRVCNPGWRGLSLGRNIRRRGRVLAPLTGPSFCVLLRDELEQSGCHGRTNVLAELGLRPSLLGISIGEIRWRWPRWRRWTLFTRWSLVVPEVFSFCWGTIWRGQTGQNVRYELGFEVYLQQSCHICCFQCLTWCYIVWKYLSKGLAIQYKVDISTFTTRGRQRTQNVASN